VDTGEDDGSLARYVAILDRAPQVAPFDRQHAYCNAGYSILGRVIESLRGVPFEEAASRGVLEPLGMARSCFAWQPRPRAAAAGHVVRDGAPVGVRPWQIVRSTAAAGGLVTSARDLLAYARFHLGERDGVLARESLEAMRRPLYDEAKSPNAMAWTVSRAGDLTLVTHGGSTVSHIAHLALVPDRHFAFAVLTNCDRGGALVREISRAALAYVGAPAARPAPPAPRPPTPARIAEYLGHYRAAIYDVRVGADRDGVWVDAVREGGMDAHQSPRPSPLPRMRLDFVADDRAIVRNGPLIEQPVWFVRDDAGAVRWVKFYGRLTPRLAE
jgi:CubicO group peptidase (beta-lactamase class C family)